MIVARFPSHFFGCPKKLRNQRFCPKADSSGFRRLPVAIPESPGCRSCSMDISDQKKIPEGHTSLHTLTRVRNNRRQLLRTKNIGLSNQNTTRWRGFRAVIENPFYTFFSKYILLPKNGLRIFVAPLLSEKLRISQDTVMSELIQARTSNQRK